MAQVALTGGVSEVVLAQGRGQAVWFQNFAAAKVWVKPAGAANDDEFCIPAGTASVPSSLVIQNSGADTTLAQSEWRAYSVGAQDLYCGRWL